MVYITIVVYINTVGFSQPDRFFSVSMIGNPRNHKKVVACKTINAQHLALTYTMRVNNRNLLCGVRINASKDLSQAYLL